jgi:hypothetical protein
MAKKILVITPRNHESGQPICKLGWITRDGKFVRSARTDEIPDSLFALFVGYPDRLKEFVRQVEAGIPVSYQSCS